MRKQLLECYTEANKYRLLDTVVRGVPFSAFLRSFLFSFSQVRLVPRTKPCFMSSTARFWDMSPFLVDASPITCQIPRSYLIALQTHFHVWSCHIYSFFLESSSCKTLWEPNLPGSRIATSHPATDYLVPTSTSLRDSVTPKMLGEKVF